MNVNWIGPALMLAGTEEQKAYHLGPDQPRRRSVVPGLLRARRRAPIWAG